MGQPPGSDDDRLERERKMLEIKVNKKDGDYFCTRINADLEEVAKYYFDYHNSQVESIDILNGGIEDDGMNKVIPLRIYVAYPEIVKKFELFYNVRLAYRIEYKEPLPDGTTAVENSRGLCKIA